MSRQDHDASLSDWVQQKLAFLRRCAVDSQEWPETADHLLMVLAQVTPLPEANEGDMEMLSLVVNDMLAGVDVGERYPAFYERMIADVSLYQMFLDAVAMLTADGREELLPVPPTTESELAFLKKAPDPHPVVARSTPDTWSVTWKLLAARMQQLLFPTPNLAWRGDGPLWEDESIVLLHDVVTIGEQHIETLLEAIKPVAEPDVLRLQVTAVGENEMPPLQVFLSWGAYRATTLLNAYGCAYFAPIALDDLVDDAGNLQIEALQLVMELPAN
ncbi:MAG: hypothetical protein IPM39_00115 [Chloroflexi bacterium]|nr:hypothetical protein [Chloroflexota bacterium]